MKIPEGRVPGTRRAARGRSRAPVASTTARAVDLRQSVRAGHLGSAWADPRRHHGAGPDVHATGGRPLDPAAGVRRAAQDPPQIAQAEAGVLAQARRPARLVLAVQDHDASRTLCLQRGGGRQAGGPGTDDQRVDRHDGAAHAFTSANRAAMAAPQKKP